ncbi:Mov34 protein [Rhizoctonia solani]|uniref:Mov34 protein n=1 Tax=Rhizoctonia solani TaxID=456999 RepID=A0A8H7M592_9AGAM|nr:Mov34 protein [Rhizoctonia solani]
MDYERMLASAASRQGGHGAGGGDQPMPDNGEVIHISSLALLKMLKHGRAGVPMEVMGLMLGEFVDDYTVQVIDVFAMPQSGTSVTVESVDHVFQTKMVEMLKQTGRMVPLSSWLWMLAIQRGHQHTKCTIPPLFYFLTSTKLNSTFLYTSTVIRTAERSLGSSRHRPHSISQGQSRHRRLPTHQPALGRPGPRTAPDDVQHWAHQQAEHPESHPWSEQTLLFIAVDYRKTELEQAMLMNLHKRNWTEGLKLKDFGGLSRENEGAVKSMLKLSEAYTKSVEEESTLTPEQLATRHVGKQDPKRHLEDAVEKAMGTQVVQSLGTMLLAEL